VSSSRNPAEPHDDRSTPRNTGVGRVTVTLLRLRQQSERPVLTVLRPVANLLTWVWLFLMGAEIPKSTRIGQRLRLPHGGRGVIIHPATVIGDDVTIYHQVTIGVRGTEDQAPTIGSGVYIGAGAAVLGGIVIGEHARIGAGAVVIRDVPPNATATGVPAEVRNAENCDTENYGQQTENNDHGGTGA
jgi:serine O-acetyltransferase